MDGNITYTFVGFAHNSSSPSSGCTNPITEMIQIGRERTDSRWRRRGQEPHGQTLFGMLGDA